jgi:hypothetical protein
MPTERGTFETAPSREARDATAKPKTGQMQHKSINAAQTKNRQMQRKKLKMVNAQA